jgi:hypothetical protein
MIDMKKEKYLAAVHPELDEGGRLKLRFVGDICMFFFT